MIDPQLHEGGDLLGVPDQAHHVAGGAHLLHGLIAAEDGALAVGPQDQDGVPLLGELAGLGGGAGHVESRQGQGFAHVGGELGIDAAFKEHCLAHDVHPVDVLVDGQNLVDAQRGQGQGHQGSDLVPHLQIPILQVLADIGHGADEHTAGAGNRVLLLAPLGHDAHDHLADLLFVAAAGLLDLGEGGGVDVQGLNVADDLVGVENVHVVVDPVRRLGEHALGLDDAMGAVLVAFECHDATSKI